MAVVKMAAEVQDSIGRWKEVCCGGEEGPVRTALVGCSSEAFQVGKLEALVGRSARLVYLEFFVG